MTSSLQLDKATSCQPSVELSPKWNNRFQRTCKRVLDIFVSLTALILLSPLYCLLALGVKLSSPGPILYCWHVVGQDAIPFVGYKFRSMVKNADDLKSQLWSQNEMTGPVFKLTKDPRVTKMGGWMRRYSLDELPQLYSVLNGDMSLVGPRPPLETEYDKFTDHQKQKLVVKPGITCLWQVNGRNKVRDFDDWVSLDLDYIRTWSLGLDFKILVHTVTAVLGGSGQ
jgi:lipopolysaccharide/colanic/teichoic acid biosynthesis glycosyltransferase